jgi:hypothetical protein
MSGTSIAPTFDMKARVAARVLALRLVGGRGAPVASVAVAAESTCLCGQALDCCHTAHCPRCGVTLRDRSQRPRPG